METNNKRKLYAKKVVILLLSMFLIISITVCDVPFTYAANEEIPQQNGEYQGEPGKMPDISELISQKQALSDAEKKLSTAILQLTDEKHLVSGMTKDKLIEQMKDQNQIKEMKTPDSVAAKGWGLSVYVYIKLKKGGSLGTIIPYVTKIDNKDESAGLAAAWVDISFLKDLAALDDVKSVREVTAPVFYAGSKQSQGDAMHNADDVRAQLGVDGTGVKIGIISNGVDHMSSAVSSGDLPSDVTWVNEDDIAFGDEGTAMLEVVHDLAPGADLYFHFCGENVIAFNNAIDALVDAGCDIICDDVCWPEEPFYEDGIIASHVADVIENERIIYVSSAGNAGVDHYQGNYRNAGDNWHDFSGGITDTTDLYAHIPAGGYVEVVLQWKEAFGKASSDYDMYMFDLSDDGNLIALSRDVQNGNDDPLESVGCYTGSATKDVAIAVHKYSGSSRNLEVYAYCSGGAYLYPSNLTTADSIFGHPAVKDAIACGAIKYSTPSTIESFSSRGPVTMLSSLRNKPDICGADGVSVTGAGSFPEEFYGTSAAAPHVAAIAGLLKSRFPTASNATIKSLLLNNAKDLGSSGRDNTYGYGRADALAASSYWNVVFDSQGGSAVSTQLVKTNGKATVPRIPIKSGSILDGWYLNPAGTNAWSFANTVAGDITLYAKWSPWVAQRDKIVSGKLQRTYYLANGRPSRIDEYFGADDTIGIYRIHYYTDGLRTSYRVYYENANLQTVVELYSNGNAMKVYYFNTAGVRTTYKLLDSAGRMTHYAECYSSGQAKKVSYYNVSTGKRTSYKLFDTAGRMTHYAECYPDGIKAKKVSYYNVSTGKRTAYKLYDTAGRMTHYAICYPDGVKAQKLNYYNVSTGIRTAYKTYRTDGSVSCYVECDSRGNPKKATYYDEKGNAIKVVNY